MVLAGGMHLVAVSGGLAFVPGMLAAAPIILALVAFPPGRSGARYACLSLLGALPMVWAFQFLGGAAPQWAGRYTLPTCIGLVALAVAGLERADPGLRRGLVALTALVPMTGVLWLSERSHSFDELFQVLVERPEDVVVARNGFLIREGGGNYTQRRWLTAVTDEAVDE